MTSCARSRHWTRSGDLVGVRAAQVAPAVRVPAGGTMDRRVGGASRIGGAAVRRA
jgi:hypothetical protein